ncbi:MAG: RNA-binding protein [Cyanobacteriota bacterium]|nr:RNA-binding protein [Cyanobacteriota bacterium]
MSVRLYIGNLPEDVERQSLEDLFTAAGEVVSTKVIRDRKTGKCRGFGFLTVATDELAEQYIAKFNGYQFGENTLKIEVAQPREKGEGGEEGADSPSPTPRLREKEASEGSEDASSKVAAGGKKKNRGGRSQSSAGVAVAATTVQPDPRWASQLQRIKEQLQAAGQS